MINRSNPSTPGTDSAAVDRKTRAAHRRLRFPALPLPAKILLCFVVNVVLAVGAGFWLLRVHFGLDRDWLLTNDARARLQAVAGALRFELESTPQSEWSGILARFSAAHRVQMALFENDGREIAGPSIELPAEAAARLAGGRPRPRTPFFRERFDRERFDRERRPDRPGPGDDGPSSRRLERGRPDGRQERERPEGRPRPELFRGPLPDLPKEAFSTSDPRRYWFLVRFPLLNYPRASLVGSTAALGESGLLFDPKPWLWTAGGVAAVSLLLWLPLVRGVTRALARVTAATEQIAGGDFSTRVDERRRDEIGRLGEAVNRMTARLDGLVTGQKRFLSDVSHELCAPLARLQLALGVLESRADPAHRATIDDVREEAEQMSKLVHELLSFSRASLRRPDAGRQPVSLAPLARSVAAREGNAEREIRVDVSEPLRVLADANLLERALANLTRNALQHGKGPVSLRAHRSGDRIGITIADGGQGVPPDSLERIFDPFFQVDPARSPGRSGTGLGLAIARTAIESCRGSIEARNRPEGGLEVTITLDAAPAEPEGE